jgi:hypothetical protein
VARQVRVGSCCEGYFAIEVAEQTFDYFWWAVEVGGGYPAVFCVARPAERCQVLPGIVGVVHRCCDYLFIRFVLLHAQEQLWGARGVTGDCSADPGRVVFAQASQYLGVHCRYVSSEIPYMFYGKERVAGR